MNVYECIADHDVALIDYGTYGPGEKLETENYIFNPNFKLVSSTPPGGEQPGQLAAPAAPVAPPPVPPQLPPTPPVVPPAQPQVQPATANIEGNK